MPGTGRSSFSSGNYPGHLYHGCRQEAFIFCEIVQGHDIHLLIYQARQIHQEDFSSGLLNRSIEQSKMFLVMKQFDCLLFSYLEDIMDNRQDKQELFTIQDIIRLTSVSQNTLYRYIRQGKIKTCKMIKNGKQVTAIEKQELERFSGHSLKVDTTSGKQDTINGSIYTINDNQDTTNGKHPDKTLTKSDIKELFQELVQEQNTLIMKPLEEQALYRLGILENEVKHLQAEKEVLRQENEALREQTKALPDKKEYETLKEEYERRGLLIRGMEMELKEKEDLLSRAETSRKEQEENEKRITSLEELHLQELEQVKKKMEEEQKTIVDAWKKELEEARRPWYKFW
jgi:hypothetical protein